MFPNNAHIGGGSPTSTLPKSQPTLDEQFRLQEHLMRLRLILPVISVVALALRRQCAEQDEDIAAVLMQHAGDPLNMEIGKLEVLLQAHGVIRHAEGAAA
jgi:hypothetical protein